MKSRYSGEWHSRKKALHMESLPHTTQTIILIQGYTGNITGVVYKDVNMKRWILTYLIILVIQSGICVLRLYCRNINLSHIERTEGKDESCQQGHHRTDITLAIYFMFNRPERVPSRIGHRKNGILRCDNIMRRINSLYKVLTPETAETLGLTTLTEAEFRRRRKLLLDRNREFATTWRTWWVTCRTRRYRISRSAQGHLNSRFKLVQMMRGWFFPSGVAHVMNENKWEL